VTELTATARLVPYTAHNHSMLRRHFLAATAASFTAAAAGPRVLGLNLYTVRDPLATKPAETYQALAALGITELEVRPDNLRNHAEMIKTAGLKPKHLFIESPIVTGTWEPWRELSARMAKRMKMAPPNPDAPKPTLDEMIALAKQHGVERIGLSFLLPEERDGSIEKLNRAAAACSAAGIGFYYHNHAFEFEGEPGARFIDRLYNDLDKRAKLEMDVFWVAIGGADPAALLKQWKGRVGSVHLKDVSTSAPRKVQEFSMPPTSFAEVGSGTLDWKSILDAAKAAGVGHYFIEQDATPGDPLESVRKSVQYLRGLKG
jgi:sugar phosphate isomerase/epimerase